MDEKSIEQWMMKKIDDLEVELQVRNTYIKQLEEALEAKLSPPAEETKDKED